MRTEYTWITKPTPKNLIYSTTIGELKKRINFLGGSIIRITFPPWGDRVYCYIVEGKLCTEKGFDDIPIATKCLIVDGKHFHAVGHADPYQPFNSVGADYDGVFTDVGRAWNGAMMEDLPAISK